MDFSGYGPSNLAAGPGGASHSESPSVTGTAESGLRVAIEATFNTEIKTADSIHTDDPVTRADANVVDEVRQIEACIANPENPGQVLSLPAWMVATADHQALSQMSRGRVYPQNPLQVPHNCPLFLWASPGDSNAIQLEKAEAALVNANEVGLVIVAGCSKGENGLQTMTVRDNMTHGEGNGLRPARGTPYRAHNFYLDNARFAPRFVPTSSEFDGCGLVQGLKGAGAKQKTLWIIFLERSSELPIPSYRIGPSPKSARELGGNTTFVRLAAELRELEHCKLIKLAVKEPWTDPASPNRSGQELANRSGKKVMVQEFRENQVTGNIELGWTEEFTPKYSAAV